MQIHIQKENPKNNVQSQSPVESSQSLNNPFLLP